MSDNQGPTPMAPPPPPAGYQAPVAPPAQPTPGYAPPVPPGYAPATGYAPPPAPKKSSTALWIVIGLLVVALIGGGIAAFMLLNKDDDGGSSGGKKQSAEEQATAEIEDALDTINEAGLEGDADVLGDYLDTRSIASAAYDDLIAYVVETPDFQDVIAQLGEEEAMAIIDEEFPREDVIAQFETDFSFEEADNEPFPDYTIEDIELDDDQAEVTIGSHDPDDEDTELEWVLAMEKRDDIWVITEFVNLVDMLVQQGEI